MTSCCSPTPSFRQPEPQLGLALHTLTDDPLPALRAHPCPGNVRELKATMRRAAVLADSRLIRALDLGFSPPRPSPAAANDPSGLRALVEEAIAPGAPIQPLATLRDEIIRRYVQLAVEHHGG